MPSQPESAGQAASDPSTGGVDAIDDWLEIAVAVPIAEAEIASAVLERFAPSGAAIHWPFIQGEDFGEPAMPPDGEARVCAYLPVRAWADEEARLRSALASAPWVDAALRASGPTVETSVVRRGDWETAWHAFVQVVRLGRLVVVPDPRTHSPEPGDVVVRLVPGLAFGTGQHETTRMALMALEGAVQADDRVLDFGTGSGILACAAARLGAARVDAVDVDPLALDATRRNAALNGVEGTVVVRQGEAPDAALGSGAMRPDPYDVVVANISAATLVRVMGALAAATAVDGICILGGVIDTQQGRVEEALTEHGLQVQGIDSDGEWRSFRVTHQA